MFHRTVCIFVILCCYASAADSLSEIRVKYHSIEDGRLHRIFSPHKREEPRTKARTVRQAAATIVNDDFDIPPDIDNHGNSSEISVQYDNEGSGIDEFIEGTGITTADETKSQSLYIRRTNATTFVMQPTTSGIKSATTSHEIKEISALIDAESSGDDILLFTTTDLTTESHLTRTPGDNTVEEIIPDICLNSTCNLHDLSVSVSDNRNSIAEGTNFTLSCKSNSSNHMLYWYKSNGSVYFLQRFGTMKELYLNLPDTKSVHSGKYICVRWVDNETCCNLESYLSVYELPLYKYHLIIIGLIAVACLIICIFLSIRHVMSLKVYTKQFVEKHGNTTKQQLL